MAIVLSRGGSKRERRVPLPVVLFRSAIGALLLVLAFAAAEAQAERGRADEGFGRHGALVLSSEHESQAAPLPDGRVIVAGDHSLRALLPSGVIDKTFGSEGVVQMTRAPGVSDPTIVGFTTDKRGRVLVISHATAKSDGQSDSRSVLLIERFNSDGRLDTSFGGEISFTQADLGLPPPTPPAEPSVLISFFVLDDEGRIIVGGESATGTYAYKGPVLTEYEPFLARFTAAGKLDTSFASGGVLRMPGVSELGLPRIGQQGRLFFAADEELVGLLPDGNPNPSFGDRGHRPMPAGTELGPVLDSSGRLLVYGKLQGVKKSRPNGLLIKRLLPNGSVDRRFGNRGTVSLRLPRLAASPLRTARLAADSRGGVLVALARREVPRSEHHPRLPPALALARLGAQGEQDTYFGRGGIAEIPFVHGHSVSIQNLELGADNALLTGTSCISPEPGLVGGGCREALARFDLAADGSGS